MIDISWKKLSASKQMKIESTLFHKISTTVTIHHESPSCRSRNHRTIKFTKIIFSYTL